MIKIILLCKLLLWLNVLIFNQLVIVILFYSMNFFTKPICNPTGVYRVVEFQGNLHPKLRIVKTGMDL